MTALQVCAYAAPYEGNFMKSLYCLESKLKELGINTIYAFPNSAEELPWCKELAGRTKVYFLPLSKARIKPNTYFAFSRIYKENPDISIVHSHFELYDIPATVMAPKSVKKYWHLHDSVEIGSGLHSIIWKIQYGCVGKKATLVSVSDKYRDNIVGLGFPVEQTKVLLNGIDLDRIKYISDNRVGDEFRFLTFGWDFYRKGDDIILDACKKLSMDGHKFTLLLNGGQDAFDCTEKYLEGEKPPYLVYCEPVEDVNKLFDEADVFIQASRRETFSYAICEAAYAGLPVLSSNIPGVKWAHELPTVKFFESESVDGLYRLMREKLEGDTVSPKSIEVTRDVITNKYTIQSWADKVISIYEV